MFSNGWVISGFCGYLLSCFGFGYEVCVNILVVEGNCWINIKFVDEINTEIGFGR